MKWIDELQKLRVIPVVRLKDADTAVPMAAALRRGGLPCAEITFCTPAAAESLRRIHEADPEFLLAAGTVLTTAQADAAMAAGAAFLVSPGFNAKVAVHCIDHGYPLVPGICTPSEIEAALSAGLMWLKFFPAEASGGVAMLRALHSPYGMVRFMPTGGIAPTNLADYLACPAVFACGGSWIVPDGALATGDFAEIERRALEATAIGKGDHK